MTSVSVGVATAVRRELPGRCRPGCAVPAGTSCRCPETRVTKCCDCSVGCGLLGVARLSGRGAVHPFSPDAVEPVPRGGRVVQQLASDWGLGRGNGVGAGLAAGVRPGGGGGSTSRRQTAAGGGVGDPAAGVRQGRGPPAGVRPGQGGGDVHQQVSDRGRVGGMSTSRCQTGAGGDVQQQVSDRGRWGCPAAGVRPGQVGMSSSRCQTGAGGDVQQKVSDRGRGESSRRCQTGEGVNPECRSRHWRGRGGGRVWGGGGGLSTG